MNICAEFHCHTLASDGRYSPYHVVKMARDAGVKALAITDHDTVDGLAEAVNAAKELDVNFIPGIELSCYHNNESIHVLGFFKGEGYKDPALLSFLEELKESRIKRGLQIVERLKKYYKIEIKAEEVKKLTTGLVARPHIAEAIINSGYNYSHEYIFENFIGNKCAGYVPNRHVSVEDGIKFLKSHGCVVLLAHPKLVKKTPVDDLMRLDFDGLEAIYFQNTPKETKRFSELAVRKNLLISCGSDFHGISPDDIKHGNVGCMNIPEEQFNKLINTIK